MFFRSEIFLWWFLSSVFISFFLPPFLTFWNWLINVIFKKLFSSCVFSYFLENLEYILTISSNSLPFYFFYLYRVNIASLRTIILRKVWFKVGSWLVSGTLGLEGFTPFLSKSDSLCLNCSKQDLCWTPAFHLSVYHLVWVGRMYPQ